MEKILRLFMSSLCVVAVLAGESAIAQQSFSQTSVQIGSVTRRTGGAVSKIKLNKPSVLQGMIVEVTGASLKLYEVRLNLDNGQSIAIEEFSKGEQTSAGQVLESTNLADKGLVASIEVKGESMGGNANVNLSVVSDQADLRMAVESTNLVNPPVQQPPVVEPPEQVTPAPPAPQPVPQRPVVRPPAPVEQQEEEIVPPRIPPRGQQRPRPQGPVVITPPAQNNGGSCSMNVCVGQVVYAGTTMSVQQAQVSRIERQGTYTLRMLGSNQISAGWTRAEIAVTTGCSGAFCIGNTAYSVTQSVSEQVQIVAIFQNGSFVLRFLSSNRLSGGWTSAEIAATRGCSAGVCVGDTAYRVTQQDSRQVQVVGVQSNGSFVLRFLDTNGLGSGWSRAEVAVTKGCGRTLCVGNTAYQSSGRGYRPVQVVAIQQNGAYVLRFLDSNGIGGNWLDSDLVRGR